MGRLFGTDGIRGVANEKLTVELAVATGRAVAASIGMAKGKSNTKKTILLAMDTRISSDMLASALTAGILSVGYDVINLGVVPTPAVRLSHPPLQGARGHHDFGVAQPV